MNSIAGPCSTSEWVTLAQAARVFRTSYAKLYTLASYGRFGEAKTLGQRYVYRRDLIEAVLQHPAAEHPSTQPTPQAESSPASSAEEAR